MSGCLRVVVHVLFSQISSLQAGFHSCAASLTHVGYVTFTINMKISCCLDPHVLDPNCSCVDLYTWNSHLLLPESNDLLSEKKKKIVRLPVQGGRFTRKSLSENCTGAAAFIFTHLSILLQPSRSKLTVSTVKSVNQLDSVFPLPKIN